MAGKEKWELTPEFLREQYKTKSMAEIAKDVGCSLPTIFRKFKKYGIVGRNLTEQARLPSRYEDLCKRLASLSDAKRLKVSKREFAALYKRMPLTEIAKKYGCGETALWKLVRRFNLKVIPRSERMRGMKFSAEHVQNLREAFKKRNFRGENNPNWKNGSVLENRKARASSEYLRWKRAALERAKYACETCGKRAGFSCDHCGHRAELHVHHIKSFADHPELRFDLSNARVLCEKCHACQHGWRERG